MGSLNLLSVRYTDAVGHFSLLLLLLLSFLDCFLVFWVFFCFWFCFFFFLLGTMTFFDGRAYFPFGVSRYSTFPFPVCFVVKWLSDYQMGKGFFCTFVAMVMGYEGQRRNGSWTSEIKLNQTTFAIRELCPQFTFVQWSYFYAKESKLSWEKRGGKGNFYLLHFTEEFLIFFLRYHIGTVLMISFYLIRFLHPFSFGVWKGIFFRTHRLLCCTGKNQYEGPGLNFLQNANQSLLSWKRRSREKVRREAL